MDVKSRLKKLRKYSDMGVVLNRILKRLEKDILNLNRDQMYEDGIMDVKNPNSILHYAPSTIKNKKSRAKFKRTDHITLKWEGDFHKTLKIKYEKDAILIFSEDKKWKAWLSPQDRFENALGLTNESLSLLRDWVKFELIKDVRNAI